MGRLRHMAYIQMAGLAPGSSKNVKLTPFFITIEVKVRSMDSEDLRGQKVLYLLQ